MAADPAQEVFPWLKSLPLAPEYHPTVAEFQDPIGYIFKIEKEASKYGICKIVPPVPAPPKKTAISNLTRSLAARDPSNLPAFTTRQQQIGFCPRKPCPVKKPVWQSGERYTYQDFEAKAKGFEKSYLKKCGKTKGVSALEMETLFWKASVDKPFSVEYANDMPGSAFAPINVKKKGEVGVGANVGESCWNMRGVSREKGSLLKFMKEEIPGVTSPMLYIAMMFSWFAWHVEDHDLHSLNYLHIGAGKTWYGVPREAAVAFEEVVRVHGYGGEVNPLVTFAVLGEKTTVMSPEVFVTAGVPCCRLVQNAGEFVVTFPRAYHSGFSHGFNCGEAANIATPEWLRVAKDAAIRRASINYPPMVSHFQLLYDLALALCSSIPVSISANPRSSRLKDKKKSEGETLIKELFVQNVVQNNERLYVLARGSAVVLLPESLSQNSLCYNMNAGSQFREGSRFSFGMCSPTQAREFSGGLFSNEVTSDKSHEIKHVRSFYNVKGKITPMCGSSRPLYSSGNENTCAATHMHNSDTRDNVLYLKDVRENVAQGDRSPEQRLFSCVTCGILTFDCAAIVEPRIPTARHLMSADCSSINDWIVGSGVTSDGITVVGTKEIMPGQNSCTELMEKSVPDGLYDIPVQSADYQIETVDHNDEMTLNSRSKSNSSALGLLALTYGNSSDSEDDQKEPDSNDFADGMVLRNSSPENRNKFDDSGPSFTRDCHFGVPKGSNFSLSRDILGNQSHQSCMTSDVETVALDGENSKLSTALVPLEDENMSICERPDEDSSRMHIFCLEHAVEVEQKLRPMGGANVFLLSHQDYPKIEAEAKSLAGELGMVYAWNDISFRDATEKDEEKMQVALDIEEATPGNGDWAVKLGINLFYSASLSRSPLYSKQMPYNSVIYNAFGRNSPDTSQTGSDIHWRRPGRQKKVVAGKWCGKVWMSTQVHPLLVPKDPDDEEQEDDRSFRGQAPHDEEPERGRENDPKPRTNTVTSKSGKKRKKTVKSGSTKKIKSEENEHKNKSVLLHRNSFWSQKVYKSRTPKLAAERYLDSDSSLDDSDHKQPRRKPVRYIERVDSGSGESLDESSHHRRPLKVKRSKLVERETVFSNDSSSDDSLHQIGRIPKSKSKHFEIEDAISNDSTGNISDEHNVRRKIGKWVWNDDANSDDSPEDDSFHLHWGHSRDRRAKHIEREKSVSNDCLENSHHQRRRIARGRRAECSERGQTDSDNSPVGKYYKSKKSLRGKKDNYIERRNTFSDDSLEDNTQQRCRIPIKKHAHRVERRDVGSDDSSEDNSHEQPAATLRRKRTRPGLTQQKNQGMSQYSKQRATRMKKQGTSRLISYGTSVQHKQETGRNIKLGNHNKSNKRASTGRKLELLDEEEIEGGPSSRLRRRTSKQAKETEATVTEGKTSRRPKKKGVAMKPSASDDVKTMDEELEYQCDIEGCTMSFGSKQELVLHKRNICPVKGCGKEFFSHKYLVQHRRVHLDDRPLKCPWKGCKMSFKWAWARTEHIRVHTGARPYVCAEPGCGQTFRFVSDFSRHKRKTGHSAKKGGGQNSKKNVSKNC